MVTNVLIEDEGYPTRVRRSIEPALTKAETNFAHRILKRTIK